MEARTIEAREGVTIQGPEDPWESEVESGLPRGTGPTDAELQADYLLEKLAEEQAALAHLREFTERRIQMIRDHEAAEGGKIEKRIAYLETRIRMCVPTDPAEFQRAYGKKSIRLPHGTLGYRTRAEAVAIADPDKATAWAKAHGVEIKVLETVNKTPLHDYVKATGEVPDPEECGFEIVPAWDGFFVKVGG